MRDAKDGWTTWNSAGFYMPFITEAGGLLRKRPDSIQQYGAKKIKNMQLDFDPSVDVIDLVETVTQQRQ